MGRKNNKKKSAKQKNRNNNNKEKRNNVPPPFIPSDEMIACLESLSVDTTGTAKDHGLVGDCPYCLDPLPPFWGEPQTLKNTKNDLHIFPCCGKACCFCCHESVIDRVCWSAKESFMQRHPQLYKDMTCDAFAETLSNNFADFAKKMDIDLLRFCPFCRFPLHDDTVGCKPSGELKFLLEKNAESGYAWPQYFFATKYLLLGNEDAEPDKTELGIEMLHNSVLKGHTLATYKLSYLYHEGLMGIKKSRGMAETLLELAVEQGHPYAAFMLHQLLKDREDYAKAWEYAIRASDLGCGSGSCLVACIYGSSDSSILENYGVVNDPGLCLKYFKIAAEQGVKTAQHYVALSYRAQGDGGKMIEYLQMAADQDYAEAQYDLGMEYFRIVAEDEEDDYYSRQKHWTASLKWLRRARDGGIDKAASLVKSLESDLGKFCFHCSAEANGIDVNKFNTCSKCKTVAYCCKECQKEDWNAGHKEFCLEYNE